MWVHAEKAPIECASAVYHVLNRGNYRQDLFTVCGSAAAFERVLRNSCARLGWRLYAYVVIIKSLSPLPKDRGREFGHGHAMAPEHIRQSLQSIRS